MTLRYHRLLGHGKTVSCSLTTGQVLIEKLEASVCVRVRDNICVKSLQ